MIGFLEEATLQMDLKQGSDMVFSSGKQHGVRWLFSNSLLEVKHDLRRLTKGKPWNKIDPIHGLLNCMYCFDFANGNIQQ